MEVAGEVPPETLPAPRGGPLVGFARLALHSPRLAWWVPALGGVAVLHLVFSSLFLGGDLALPFSVFFGLLWVLGWTVEYQKLPLRLSRKGYREEAARLARTLAATAWTRTMSDAHHIDEAAFLVNAGRLEEAKQVLSSVAPEQLPRRLQPFYFDVQSVLLLKVGDAETALDMNRAALAMLDTAYQELRPMLLFNQGLSLGILGRFAEAMDCLEQVPLDELPDHQQKVYTVQRALIALSLDRVREAARWTDRLDVPSLPLEDLHGMLVPLALGYALRGQVARALGLLEEIASHPDAREGLAGSSFGEVFALSLLLAGRTDEAEEVLPTCPGWTRTGPIRADLGLLWLGVLAGRGEGARAREEAARLEESEEPFILLEGLLVGLGRALWFPDRVEESRGWTDICEELSRRFDLGPEVARTLELEAAFSALARGELEGAEERLDALATGELVDPLFTGGVLKEAAWVAWIRGEEERARELVGRARELGSEGVDEHHDWLLDPGELAPAELEELPVLLERWDEVNLLERAWAAYRALRVAAQYGRPDLVEALSERLDGHPLEEVLRARLARDGVELRARAP